MRTVKMEIRESTIKCATHHMKEAFKDALIEYLYDNCTRVHNSDLEEYTLPWGGDLRTFFRKEERDEAEKIIGDYPIEVFTWYFT